jgi:hypothetical protein
MYVHFSVGGVRLCHFGYYKLLVCFQLFFLGGGGRDSFAKNLQIGDWITSTTIRRGNGFKISLRISKKCPLKILLFFLFPRLSFVVAAINSLNAELILICHLLALLEAQHILHVSRIRVKYKMYKI